MFLYVYGADMLAFAKENGSRVGMEGPRAYGAIFGAGILAGAMAVATTITKLGLHPAKGNDGPMSYADLAAIMLGAVSVIVTVLGVVIAILALWGFRHFKETAQKAATSRVDDVIPEITRSVELAAVAHVRESAATGEIRRILEDQASYLIRYGAEMRAKEEWEGNEESEYGD